MPKGHQISVPRTWPGHRDCLEVDSDLARVDIIQGYADSELPVVDLNGDAALRAQEIIARRITRDTAYGPMPGCLVRGGSCELCDDDHCREL